MLKLILGKPKTGKSEQIFSLIEQNGAYRKQILIVPEQFSHETERKICEKIGNKSSRYCEVLSFSRLATRILSCSGKNSLEILDAGGKILLMNEAIKLLSGKLTRYDNMTQKVSFLEGLILTSDELKTYCIKPEELLDAVDNSANNFNLYDIGLILSCYNSLLSERANDPRDKLTIASEEMDKCNYAENSDIYFDSFMEFTPQQMLLIEKLLQRCNNMTFAIRYNSRPDSVAEEYMLPYRKTILSLLDLAKQNNSLFEYSILRERIDKAPVALTVLQDNIFKSDIVPYKEQISIDSIQLYKNTNPYKEVEFVAGEIINLVRDKGYKWRNIVVASRTMEAYSDIIESVFDRYKIPVFMGKVEDILQKPILTLITSALDSISSNYEYEDIFKYLKTGLTGVSTEDVDLLENYVIRWQISGNKWTQEDEWHWHPDGYGKKFTDAKKEELKKLDELRRRIIKPLEKLRTVKRDSGKKLVELLYNFLVEIELPQRLNEQSEKMQNSGMLQLADEYCQLWDILCGAIEQCYNLLGDDVIEMKYFADLFKLVLSQYNVSSIPVSLDRVHAGEMQRFTYRDTKVLFLLGVNDNNFPLIFEQSGLLSDDDRTYLNSLGYELAPNLEKNLSREITHAYNALCIPSEKIYISYCQRSTDNSEIRPANIIANAKKLFSGIEEHTPDISLRYNTPITALEVAAEEDNYSALNALKELKAFDNDLSSKAVSIENACKLKNEHLSKDIVKALYGNRVRLSPSKIEMIKSCHFEYFMEYGLNAQARKKAAFNYAQKGTFIHYVLEYVFRRAKEVGGIKTLDDIQIKNLIEQATNKYLSEEFTEFDAETARFKYLFNRLLKSVETIVLNIAEELRKSDFEPVSFEFGFGTTENSKLPAITVKDYGVTLSISGFVDRIDAWENEGKVYLRVNDYKSGHKSFNLTDVWYGLELQMLLYLFNITDNGKRLFSKEAVSSGVLYVPAHTDIVNGSRNMTDEEIKSSIDKDLKRSGLLLNDSKVLNAMENLQSDSKPRFIPITITKNGGISGQNLATMEQWGKMYQHVDKMLHQIACEIANGDVLTDPYKRADNTSPCDNCDNKKYCHFEDGTADNHYRFLKQVTKEEFFAD